MPERQFHLASVSPDNRPPHSAPPGCGFFAMSPPRVRIIRTFWVHGACSSGVAASHPFFIPLHDVWSVEVSVVTVPGFFLCLSNGFPCSHVAPIFS
ncbi:hypothetical protein RSOLAG1IB_06461 [Rhizoctonia solani AG-1 IB]|uniref:Uncharacterized protein n=1 Tax=Thanatephorus cucumeris (strain AG1-IB / isolate 7/3/14) TaxID=1108050 RepID=A0A0B7F6C4_THACB|nr:hypothetical protein RSOLAG1IB_06461 [Rhizoctonia solani AG-1 IB]